MPAPGGRGSPPTPTHSAWVTRWYWYVQLAVSLRQRGGRASSALLRLGDPPRNLTLHTVVVGPEPAASNRARRTWLRG